MIQTRTLIGLYRDGQEYAEWYTAARKEIRKTARMAGWDRRRFCDVLAMTSPRCHVRRNIRLAIHYMKTGEHMPAAMDNIRSSIAHYELTGEIRGPKTRPFADALYGSDEAIVIDSWMEWAFGLEPKASTVKDVHRRMCGRIRDAASTVGVYPAQLQAAVWIHARELAGYEPIGYPVIEEFERFTTTTNGE